MSTEMFPRAAYDQSLMPPDEPEDDEDIDHSVDTVVYVREAKTLDTESLMLIVAERFSDSNALRALVEDTKRAPFISHDRKTLHISDAMRLGDALAALLADAMDELVEQRLAGQSVA